MSEKYIYSAEEEITAAGTMDEKQKEQSIERLAEMKQKITEWLPKAERLLDEVKKGQAELKEVAEEYENVLVVDIESMEKNLEKVIENAKRILEEK